MSVKKGLDVNNLRIVAADEIPKGRIKVNKWMEIFDRIPVGKALVVTEDEVSFVAVRSAISDLQRKGLYKHLRVRKVKEPEGYRLYVINEMQLRSAEKI
ncbi:MAG: hypothetical protein M1540_02645 [Candidatus Bathyarchaeota archaeon]|nr:hypothetical protein [Candidatus Bathyarchaeota archaeon]